jgi:hypothetical protein
MLRIKRWFGSRRQLLWSEPKLPPFVKVNPNGTSDPATPLQPGDITMGAIAREFLDVPEEEEDLRW